MATSAQGIAGNAIRYRGVVRRGNFIHIILLDDADEPLPNVRCKIKFQNGQSISVESDNRGVLAFLRKAPGEFEIEMLEEEVG